MKQQQQQQHADCLEHCTQLVMPYYHVTTLGDFFVGLCVCPDKRYSYRIYSTQQVTH